MWKHFDFISDIQLNPIFAIILHGGVATVCAYGFCRVLCWCYLLTCYFLLFFCASTFLYSVYLFGLVWFGWIICMLLLYFVIMKWMAYIFVCSDKWTWLESLQTHYTFSYNSLFLLHPPFIRAFSIFFGVSTLSFCLLFFIFLAHSFSNCNCCYYSCSC